ncbi:MAG TPA: ATP-dependent Clp protease ATP-binding subunit [Candidatus Dojkabacteria bacterium]|nr:ATP-dependent Clp protease ATP-binding subunit [Candidatus Dojkabacteria bacterium]
MFKPVDNTKRLAYGVHNRVRNKYEMVKKNYPLIIDNELVPFLMTRDNIFISNLEDLQGLDKRFKQYKLYHSIINRIANIVIIPGILVSIIYILKIFGNFSYVALLENILPDNILNTIFWFSTLGIILLWYGNYREFFKPRRIPKLQVLTDYEVEQIKNNEVKFGRYATTSTSQYISANTLNFLNTTLDDYKLNPLKMLKDLLKEDDVKIILKRANLVQLQKFVDDKNITGKNMPSYPIESIKSLMIYAVEEALLTSSVHIEPVHIFLSLIKVFPALNKFLESNNSSLWILREALMYEEGLTNRVTKSIFDPDQSYNRTGGIGREWVYGYTYILSHFSHDLNLEVANAHDTYGIGHEDEVNELISIIGRVGKRNALLIGDPGVGKSSMIKGLAQRINTGDVPPQLIDKRIIRLDLNGLIAYSGKSKNVETVVQRAIEELSKAGNTILYIDELQELIPAKAEESGHSLAGLLLPYIVDSKFPIVGTTNYASYKKYFYTNESFRQSFTNIELGELSPKETMEILRTKIETLEDNFGIYITIPALTDAIEFAQRYVQDRMLPDSAVDLLESGCAWVQSNNVKILTGEHIAKVTSLQTNIDVASISSDDINDLGNLVERIKARVVGEDEAVEAIVETLKRAKTGLRSPDKPIGVFLFIGPTGVGKTYLAKIVAEEFFKSKEDIVRIDMSEYKDEGSVSKLLGSSNDKNETSISLIDKVKVNPYTIVLFDEFEKANPEVLDLFLQLFDEGRLTSTSGETVSFNNTIIVCTSNIGSDIIMEEVSKKNFLWDDVKNKVLMKLKQSIKAELFNRFDSVVIFEPQTIDSLAQVSNMILEELSSRLDDQGIELKWSDVIPMLIANKAYDPALGARPIKRYVQEKVEGKIATDIVNGEIKKGDTVNIKESWII